jgi:hypothetical protein
MSCKLCPDFEAALGPPPNEVRIERRLVLRRHQPGRTEAALEAAVHTAAPPGRHQSAGALRGAWRGIKEALKNLH